MSNNTEIGMRIRGIRKSQRLTQKELGALIGVSPSAIMRYELGERRPSIDMLRRLAGALDAPLSALIGEEATNTETDGGHNLRGLSSIARDLGQAHETVRQYRRIDSDERLYWIQLSIATLIGQINELIGDVVDVERLTLKMNITSQGGDQ